MVRIGQQRHQKLSVAAALHLGDNVPQLFERIWSDGDDHRGPLQTLGKQLLQLNELRGAVRSPIATVEHQDDILAAQGTQADIAAGR